MLDIHPTEFAVAALATTKSNPFDGLAEALTGVRPDLPLLDLGSGTGNGTLALAEAVPEAEVIAVENDEAQRIALMTRLAAHPGLWNRISVVAGDLFTASLPRQCGAMLANHLLCQMDRPGRRRLIRFIADHLADGCPAVVDWHYDRTEPDSSPDRLILTFTIGRHTYERWFAARPQGADATRVTQTYRVLEGDVVVRHTVNERVVELIRGDELLADIEASGLAASRVGEKLLVLRRRAAESSMNRRTAPRGAAA